jgi:anthranilate phosphoribosyltransferase
LSDAQVDAAARDLAASDVADAEKGDFLIALSDKGESPAEVAAFAVAFRSVAIDPGVQEWAPRAIDIVGTGGDHAGGFNVSSLVVLVLACSGMPVMKHGNRGVTSKCGSADLFSALGFDISAPPAKLQEALRQLGYVFFFAPNYHPSFKHIAPVRRALAAQGRRTVFNILGPLINPGRPANIILGVFSPSWVEKLAHALTSLGTESGLAVHGVIGEGRGIDELTTATENQVQGVGRMGYISDTWRASDFGLEQAPFSDLIGGDIKDNLALVDAVLGGRGPRGLVDTIVLNAAAGLRIAGRIGNIQEGLAPCRELLLGGAVRARIDATREFFRT